MPRAHRLSRTAQGLMRASTSAMFVLRVAAGYRWRRRSGNRTRPSAEGWRPPPDQRRFTRSATQMPIPTARITARHPGTKYGA